MIGFILRSVLSPLLLVGGVCICFQCCRRLSIRDCGCIRWLFRFSGIDSFDDFEALIHVSECYTGPKSVGKVWVRITAGREQASTDPSSKGSFHKLLNVFIEQGTEYVTVDIMNGRSTVLATLELCVEDDILPNRDNSAGSKIYGMKKHHKSVDEPSVTLIIYALSDDDLETGILSGANMESAFLLNNHLTQAQNAIKDKEGVLSAMKHVLSAGQSGDAEMIDVLMEACSGDVKVFTGWGGKKSKYMKIIGPPKTRHFQLCIFKDQKGAEKDSPDIDIDILKIVSVRADTGKSDVFHITHQDQHKAQKTVSLVATDRAVKVWEETLILLVERIHHLHDTMKKHKENKSGPSDSSHGYKSSSTKRK